jgi:hypothetical protein
MQLAGPTCSASNNCFPDPEYTGIFLDCEQGVLHCLLSLPFVDDHRLEFRVEFAGLIEADRAVRRQI